MPTQPRKRAYISERMKLQVAERAAHICEYCQSQEHYAVQTFECEHIIPVSLGGTNELDNLAWACGGCNRHKAAILIERDLVSGSPRSKNMPK